MSLEINGFGSMYGCVEFARLGKTIMLCFQYPGYIRKGGLKFFSDI